MQNIVVWCKLAYAAGDDYCRLPPLEVDSTGRDLVDTASAFFRTALLADFKGPRIGIEMYHVTMTLGVDSPSTADESNARGGRPVTLDTRLDRSFEGAHFLVVALRGKSCRDCEGSPSGTTCLLCVSTINAIAPGLCQSVSPVAHRWAFPMLRWIFFGEATKQTTTAVVDSGWAVLLAQPKPV